MGQSRIVGFITRGRMDDAETETVSSHVDILRWLYSCVVISEGWEM